MNESINLPSHWSHCTRAESCPYLEIGSRRLLIGDHVLGLVEPAEERLESLFQLARVQQRPVQTLVSVGDLKD